MYDTDYIAHHGIFGQKWGKRRYQYEDGSLTPEGVKRYRNEKKKTSILSTASKQGVIRKSAPYSKYLTTSTDNTAPTITKTFDGWQLSNVEVNANDQYGATITGAIENEDIVGSGDKKREWNLSYALDHYGNKSIKVIDRKYEASRVDTRTLVQKAANTYISGWNTIKDTYVSGLKTIGSWFKW